MRRFLFVFTVGILCALVAMVVLMGHWFDRGHRAGRGGRDRASVGRHRWRRSRKVTDTDPTDEDPERAKTYQYMMRNKSQPPGGGL